MLGSQSVHPEDQLRIGWAGACKSPEGDQVEEVQPIQVAAGRRGGSHGLRS